MSGLLLGPWLWPYFNLFYPIICLPFVPGRIRTRNINAELTKARGLVSFSRPGMLGMFFGFFARWVCGLRDSNWQ
uniref:hypothetical protein n=1 Tax=Castellaniella defragrans TaxID=75697 RepID=UPI00333EFF03